MATDRLSALDYAFLALESPSSPKHVAGLAIFEPAGDAATPDLRARLEHLKTISAEPPFDRKLGSSLFALPAWVEEADMDLDWHVRHVALPKPGSRDQLMRLVSRLHERMLDRSRPLWEFYLIEGLQGGCFATYLKVHHAYMDGISMVKRVTSTFADSPDDETVVPVWGTRRRKRRMSDEERSLLNDLAGQLQSLGGIAQTVPELSRVLFQHAARATGLGDRDLPIPFTAPRSQLNEPLTSTRGVGIADLSLKAIRKVAAAADVTVNDVLLSLCDGALSTYLEDVGEVPDKPLVAQMPISLRRGGERSSGNQITIALVELATGEKDPVRRVRLISDRARRVKNQYGRMSEVAAATYTLLTQLTAQATELLNVSRLLPPLGNVVISNVIGPREPGYLQGAKVRGMYPISTIPPGVSINITFFTCGDVVSVGIVAGREAVADVAAVADGIVAELSLLEKALKAGRN